MLSDKPDTSTEAVEQAYNDAKSQLRSQIACWLLGRPITVGDFFDRIETLAAERDALQAERDALQAERDALQAQLGKWNGSLRVHVKPSPTRPTPATSPDDLAKVEALVEAAEMMVKVYREESDKVITGFYALEFYALEFYALEEALAAMKGNGGND
jgi:hypothetical protein